MSLIGKTVQRIDAKGNVVYRLRVFMVVGERDGYVMLRDAIEGRGVGCVAGWFSAARVRVVEENKKGE